LIAQDRLINGQAHGRKTGGEPNPVGGRVGVNEHIKAMAGVIDDLCRLGARSDKRDGALPEIDGAAGDVGQVAAEQKAVVVGRQIQRCVMVMARFPLTVSELPAVPATEMGIPAH